jgi:hypothetical protein
VQKKENEDDMLPGKNCRPVGHVKKPALRMMEKATQGE